MIWRHWCGRTGRYTTGTFGDLHPRPVRTQSSGASSEILVLNSPNMKALCVLMQHFLVLIIQNKNLKCFTFSQVGTGNHQDDGECHVFTS